MRKSLVAAVAAAGILLTACAGGTDAPLTVPDITPPPTSSPTVSPTGDDTNGSGTDDTTTPGVNDADVLRKVRNGEVLSQEELARYQSLTEKDVQRQEQFGPAAGGAAASDASWTATQGLLPESEKQTSGAGDFTADEVNEAASLAAYATKSNLGLQVVKYDPKKADWSLAEYQDRYRSAYMTADGVKALEGLAALAERDIVREGKSIDQTPAEVRRFWSWFPAGLCTLGPHIERDPCVEESSARFGVESVTPITGDLGVEGLRIQTVSSYTAHVWTEARLSMRVTYTLWRNPDSTSPVKWVIGDITFDAASTEVVGKPYWTPKPQKEDNGKVKAAGTGADGFVTAVATPILSVLNSAAAFVAAQVTPACTGNACGGGGSGTGPIGGDPGGGGGGGPTPDPCDGCSGGGSGGGSDAPPLVCPTLSSTDGPYFPPRNTTGTVTDPNTGVVMGTHISTTTIIVQAPYGVNGIQSCVTVSTSTVNNTYSPPVSAAASGPCLTGADIYLKGPYTREMREGTGFRTFPQSTRDQSVRTPFGNAFSSGNLASGLECLNAQSTRMNFDENLTLYGRYAGNYTSYARNVTIVWVPNWSYAGAYYPTTYRGVTFRAGQPSVTAIGNEYVFEDTDWRFVRNCEGFFNRTGQNWGDGALTFYTENFCGPGDGPDSPTGGGGGGRDGDVLMQCVNWASRSNPMYRVDNSNGTATNLPRTTGLVEVRANNAKPASVDWRPSGLTPASEGTAAGSGIRITDLSGNNTYPVLAYEWASRFDLSSNPDRRSPSLSSSSPSSTVRQKASDDNSPSQPYFVLDLNEEQPLRLSRWYGNWDVATSTINPGVYDSTGKVDGLRAGFLLASRQGRDWQVTPTWRHTALTRIPTDVIEAFRLSQGGLGQPITVVPVYGSATEEVIVTLDCSAAPTRLRATEVNVTGR